MDISNNPSMLLRTLIGARNFAVYATAILIFSLAGTAQAAVVDGYRVEQVAFGDGDKNLGAYFQTGPNEWKETNSNGKTTFQFTETHRDQWKVYLHDSSRHVEIQIDLNRKKILYSDPQRPIEDLYDILSATAVNGWLVAQGTYGALNGNGEQLGAVFQTGPDSWVERNVDGLNKFEFEEVGRDDWSVYLFDASRQVTLQVDNWTKKVFYSDPGTPRREQYGLINAQSINGWIVREAFFGNGANNLGSYRRVGDTKGWQELDKNGNVTFNFVEQGRDEWSVYLKDSSRDVLIQIDIWTNKIKYTAPNSPQRDLYSVLYAN